MRITIMNASPKKESSASQQLIDRLIPFLKEDEYGILQVNQNMDESLALTAANLSDAWIIVAPIYIYSLPSSMLAFLDDLEAKVRKKGVRVGAVLQCGFYEADNTKLAMQVIQQWCQRNGYTFAAGIGIGGGGCIQGLTKMPTGKLLMKPLKPAYENFVKALHGGEMSETYFSVPMPKGLYQWMAEGQWKKAIRQQGLEAKDLAYQPKGPANENVSKDN